MGKIEKIDDSVNASGFKERLYQETDDKGRVRLVKQNIVDSKDAAMIMTQNQLQRMSGDGFSKDRNHRQVGVMLLTDFLAMKKDAEENGGVIERKDFEKYFDENPGMRTAPKYTKSGIIIK